LLRRLFCLLLALPLPAQKVALSLDDAPFLRPSPRLAAPAQHQAMLAALKARKVQAILFANGVNGGDTAEGKAILRAWGEAGHLLANHSYSHWDLNREEVTLAAYEADALRGEALLRELPGFTWMEMRNGSVGSTMSNSAQYTAPGAVTPAPTLVL